MEKISVTVGLRVRYYRWNKKLSQEQLAELCGLHPVYIGQLERGEKNASLETIMSVCRGLEISPSTLFENISASESEPNFAQSAYDLFLTVPKDKQEKLLELLQKAVELI